MKTISVISLCHLYTMGRSKHPDATKIQDIKLVIKYLEREYVKTRGKKKTAFAIQKTVATVIRVSTSTVERIYKATMAGDGNILLRQPKI